MINQKKGVIFLTKLKLIKKAVVPILIVTMVLVIAVMLNTKISSADDINTKGMGISSGSYSGTSFGPAEYSLNKSNGQYINFWIKNTGNVNVKIKINDTVERTFKPGEEGHITAQFSRDSDEDFIFKAVPTPNGGKISIDYRIAQRHIKQ